MKELTQHEKDIDDAKSAIATHTGFIVENYDPVVIAEAFATLAYEWNDTAMEWLEENGFLDGDDLE